MHPYFKMKTVIRVPFEDIDAFNVVHNAKYFCYFERGRVEYLRHLGFMDDGDESLKNLEVAIVEHYCSYRKPARFDDDLSIHLRISYLKNSSFQFQYLITRDEESSLLTLGYSNLVFFNSVTLKPKTLNPELRDAVTQFEGDHLGQMTGIPEL
ncbi:acyl-CoA thioesterase [candidate division KSB1 bacterium]